MALARSALALVFVLAVCSSPPGVLSIYRSDFSPDFVFGVATSSYQYEGAYNESKGFTIWDNFTHTQPGKIADKSNGDVALDSYHRYKRDVALAKNVGVDAYRFSIAWARILPNGTVDGGINQEGVEYYDKLIDELVSKGLKPFATLFHWDLPEALEDRYGGFLSPQIAKDYVDYANICFEKFGNRVKHWITFNEPLIFVSAGFDSGIMAPGRCGSRKSCAAGNSGTEPYVVAHHLLLAHAAAVRLYRDKYQDQQKGTIGITQTTTWFLPLAESNKSDVDATQRALDFNYGWFMDPIVYGDYPFIMRAVVGDRLPKFTAEESELLKGSYDFIGINYYTTSYVFATPYSSLLGAAPAYSTDSSTQMTYFRNSTPIGPVAGSTWLYIYPKGIKDLVMYTKEKYNDPIIYITENGVDELNASIPLSIALRDKMRIDYYRDHLFYLHKAISEGARVKGYFMWTLMDDFEWFSGFTIRFGLYYVDYKGLKIYPKDSVHWFRKFFNLN